MNRLSCELRHNEETCHKYGLDPTTTTSLSIEKLQGVRLHTLDPEVFGSLDELKEASNSLLPPFKTVGACDESPLQGFDRKAKAKVYTSQTILHTKEITLMQRQSSHCGIREITQLSGAK